MQPFRKSPQHNTSTSTAFNDSTVLEAEEYRMSLFSGLKEIASLQERVLRLQDKVEHPSLYCTEQDVQAGMGLFRSMQEDLLMSQDQLRETDIQGKLTRISSDITEFNRTRDSLKSRYKRAEARLIERGYVPPARLPVFPPDPTNSIAHNNTRMDASFIKEVPSNINLPVISPSPIPIASQEPAELQQLVTAHPAITPELFRKLSKQCSAGAEHIRAVMGQSSADSIETCSRNEPVGDVLMTLAGPIRAERLIPPPLAESPICLREFRFPATPTQRGNTPSQLNTPNIPASGSTSNLVTAYRNAVLITESQYNELPSFITKRVSLSELNTNLNRFRELTQGPRGRGHLSDQELAEEVGSVSKLSLIKQALLKLNIMQLVNGEEALYSIH